jgi:hypothetical protein
MLVKNASKLFLLRQLTVGQNKLIDAQISHTHALYTLDNRLPKLAKCLYRFEVELAPEISNGPLKSEV